MNVKVEKVMSKKLIVGYVPGKVEAKSNVKVVLLEIGENYNVPE